MAAAFESAAVIFNLKNSFCFSAGMFHFVLFLHDFYLYILFLRAQICSIAGRGVIIILLPEWLIFFFPSIIWISIESTELFRSLTVTMTFPFLKCFFVFFSSNRVRYLFICVLLACTGFDVDGVRRKIAYPLITDVMIHLWCTSSHFI